MALPKTKQQSLCSTMWWYIAVFLLSTGPGGCKEKTNTSDLIEYTPEAFYEKLYAGKTMFTFFERQVSPTISLFLMELEKSADALQDYGVHVGKVNCNKELVSTYCTDERLLHRAFLFRGGKEFLSFDLDILFDVNSIVSEILFAILREEVKYVHTDTDLMIMEKAARGRQDIVLGYVLSLGTREHRSLMETAYAYGSKYQFILITGGPVLKYLGVEFLSESRVWFLHCRLHSGTMSPMNSERCMFTNMLKPLTTLNLHSFLQLMEAPLVTEVYDDPSSVQPPPVPYQDTPQVFLFSRPATAHLDLDTATTLAWKLRGLALVLLVHRQSPAVKTPDEYNVAYRLTEKNSEVKYLTLQDLDELFELFGIRERNQVEEQEEEEEKDAEYHEKTKQNINYSRLYKLDDEVAASVYENPDKMPDMDSITHLTFDNFHEAVAQSSLTVAVFYFKWDAVSLAFLSSFIAVADRLEDSNVQMSGVDCGEWTHLCAAQSGGSFPIPFQPITTFPSVLLLRPKEPAQHYSGMLDAVALHRFIILSQQASPVLLSTQEEVTSFLHQAPHPQLARYKPERVLGLFKKPTQAGFSVFTKAAKSLRGKVLTGLLTDDLADKWAIEHAVDLPAVFMFPSWRTNTRPTSLPVSDSAEELVSHINSALLHPMPELTVENLPTFLSLGKALLLLFVGEEEDDIGHRQNQALLEEMKGVVESGEKKMEKYLVSWIHLGRTPAGMSVLGSYLGSMPPLPALVLAHLASGDEIYQYPTNTPIVASSVLQWLQRIEDGAETPAGMLGDDSWPPTVDYLDLLKIIDIEQTPEEEQKGRKDKVKKDVGSVEDTDSSSSAHISDHNPAIHSEL